MFMLACAIGWAQLGTQVSTKLDDGLSTATGMRSVFIRMKDQLFHKGGDFERFCEEHDGQPRSETRKFVLGVLHKNADASWAGMRDVITTLESKDSIRSVQRFWILNGFACEADAKACEAMAQRPDVEFIYAQTGSVAMRQQPRRRRDRPVDDARDKAMKEAISKVKDDSDDPFDAKGLEIAWDLKQIQADQVWEAEHVTGKGAIVAVNDQGLYALPCLESALWRNPKPGKDGDVFGWDAGDRTGAVLGNEGVGHGTICAGIIAGRPTAERKQVTGVAPRAKIMIVNGMGYLSAFEYAVEHGADVFSMSYMFVNMEIGAYRGVYRLAAEDMTAAGTLLCGGAGNFAKSAPEGKQIAIPKDIPCVLCVAGTNEAGDRPAFSSKGPVSWAGVKFYDDYPKLVKPDVSAPATGFPCWGLATDLRQQWKKVFTGSQGDVLVTGPQGNSFAGPHAAGVAALMFSANREIQPWRVKRIIEETAKDIGPVGRDPLHGAGIIQALAAVRAAKALRL